MGILHANKPVNWNEAGGDRDMWFTYGHNKSYVGGYERVFGDTCPECGEHMEPGEYTLHCESCGCVKGYSC